MIKRKRREKMRRQCKQYRHGIGRDVFSCPDRPTDAGPHNIPPGEKRERAFQSKPGGWEAETYTPPRVLL
jgi:hypothetical protein